VSNLIFFLISRYFAYSVLISEASLAAGDGVIISVAGHSFRLPASSFSAFSASLSHASAYQQLLSLKTSQH
jgi:hypothetical protein